MANSSEYEFKSSDDAEQARLYSSDRREVEAANRFLKKGESNKPSRHDRKIVKEAKKQFGYLSSEIQNATFVQDIIPELKFLAIKTATSASGTSNDILEFMVKHNLGDESYGR